VRDILGCGHRSTVANPRLTVNPVPALWKWQGLASPVSADRGVHDGSYCPWSSPRQL